MKQGSAAIRAPISTEAARSIPHVSRPSASVLAPTNQSTDAYTYFTKATGVEQQLYTGDRPWAEVKLTLETAGPVAVATKQNFTPVLSGKGTLLRTGQEKTFTCPKGARIWIASTSVNRVSVVVQPFSWLEQLYATMGNDAAAARAMLDELVKLPKAVAAALAQIFGRK